MNVIKSMLFIATFLILGCSTDEKESVQQNKLESDPPQFSSRTSGEVARMRENYLTILSSSQYVNFLNNAQSFSSKLPSDYDFLFRTDIGFSNWLDSNISRTTFSSKSEAISNYMAVKEMYQGILNSNSEFFDDLAGFRDDEIGVIIYLPAPEEPVYETNSCIKKCKEDSTVCYANAYSNYNSDMTATHGLPPVFVPAAQIAVVAKLMSHIIGCGVSYSICANGC